MIWVIQVIEILLNIFLIKHVIGIPPGMEWTDNLASVDNAVKCKMQPNGFDCSQWRNGSFLPRYYYDLKMQMCRTFEYYECKIALNNFMTLFECNQYCRVPGRRPVDETRPSLYCRLQPDFGDCQSYFPMFYYDISSRTCKGFSYGGCGGNRNKFHNHQQCMALCSGVVAILNK